MTRLDALEHIEGLDDLVSLALLVSVVELGSLSQAGARHGITQPAASARLARLEAELGVRLVDRSTHGCRPTPAGAAVAQWSDELLTHAERIGRAVRALREAGDRSIAASLTVAEHLLPAWLANLHAQWPETKVRVTVANSESVVDLVRDGHVELGFIETTGDVAGLRSRLVGRDELVVVVPARHAWSRRRTPLQPHQLAATALVLREVGSGTRSSFERALERSGHMPADPVLELASTAAVRSAVAAGVAPTVISELAVADDVTAGRLVVVPTTGIDLGRPLRAVWRGGPAPELLSQLAGGVSPAAAAPMDRGRARAARHG